MEYAVDDVLNFWFGENLREKWFSQGSEFDQEIAERFINLVDFTSNVIDQKGVAPWEGEPRGDLASIILLDQFPRHIYRGTPRAYACDASALALAHRAMGRESDLALPEGQRPFVYMPLMHAEDLEVQENSVLTFKSRLEDQGNSPWAEQHLDTIRRFGRFPHRNAILGRQSTEEEIRYMEDGGFSG